MNKRLETIFDLLETQRLNLLAEVKNIPPDRLETNLPGKWSIQQILAHLIAAERLSLLYLRKKVLAVNEVPDTGLLEEAKMLLLKISQRMPWLKFKAPKVVVEHTRSSGDLEQLIKEWEGVRSEMKAFLEKFPEAHNKRKIYRHAIAGRLNIQHGLLFLREHVIHHLPQIRRLASTRVR